MIAIGLEHYLLVAGVMFAIGACGFMLRRNVLISLMSIELMLNGANIALVAFNRWYANSHTGQLFAFFAIAVAASETAVGLAIVIAMARLSMPLRTDHIDQLRH